MCSSGPHGPEEYELLFFLSLQETSTVQNRKENVQLIVSINAKGQPVYTNGVPALLERSLSRLKNIVKDQVVHYEAKAHEAVKAAVTHDYLLFQLNLADDIKRQLAEAWLYDNAPDTKLEAEHWLVDFPGCSVNLFDGGKAAFINRGFVSRIHVSEYFGMQPGPEVDQVGEVRLTEELLAYSGYVLDQTDWETLPFRKGGPTCARLRHRTYRHTSIPKQAPTVLFVDDSASAVAAAIRVRDDNINRQREAVSVKQIVDPTPAAVKRNDIDEFTGLRKPNWRVG